MSAIGGKTGIRQVMFSVLYVDDEPLLLELAKLFLEKTGDFRIDTLTSAKAALETLARTSYDCIISDYQMPGMDGIVFLKTVRSHGSTIPFIIFTGKGREDVVIEALNSGADFYLQKGGDPKAQFVELAHKIRQAIQIKGAQKTMQDLVQGAPIPEFVIDKSHRVIFWNRALEEYSGLAASEIVNTTNHWKAFYPTQRPCLADLIVDGNIDGITRWYAGKHVKSPVVADNFEATDYFPSIKGGTWLFFTAAPIRDPSGNITGAIETLQDVTSLRKKEEELRAACEQMEAAFEHAKASEAALNIQHKRLEASEQRYRDVVEDQTEFISRFLPDGTHVFVNEAYCRYYHKTREEIIGKKFIPEVPAEDRVLLKEHFASLTRDHPLAIITHRIIADGGEVRWQRWSDRAIFDENGTLTEYQSVGSDVTEQKRADEALRESEASLASIFRVAPVGIGLVSDRVIVRVNDRISEMTGYSYDDLVGQSARILYPTDEDSDFVGKVKYDMIRKQGAGTVETRWLRKDGVIRDILLSSTPVNPPDISAGVMFTALDITDRKNAEAELHTAYEQLAKTEEELRKQYSELAHAKESLKEANRKLHLLSSITRHDVLNKITVLRGNIELIRSRSGNPAIAGFLTKLDSAAIAIREQIEFTRIYQDLGSHEPRWHKLDMVISSLEVPPNISLRQSLDHIEIYADPILEKVFYNFLDNSVMHGKKVTTITVSSREFPEGLVISWEDDGIGIPAEEKKKIFTRFFGKHTGLGLFLAHEICSVTGITLRERGEPGKGALFEMLVPKTAYRFTGTSEKNLLVGRD
ncbi:MAG TPA: PAS domain S-box protein [Methanoregula sp.]|nr:PAS domain S-box protein [Methanoregula sp.]